MLYYKDSISYAMAQLLSFAYKLLKKILKTSLKNQHGGYFQCLNSKFLNKYRTSIGENM